MTFDDLRLITAIHTADLPRGDPASQRARMRLCRAVFLTYSEMYQTCLFPWDVDYVIDCFLTWRKSGPNKVKAEVAIRHGAKCFWVNRDKGPCCSDAELGHLVPKCKGGPLTVENCVIECHSHNNQRREMTIEEYILSEMRTA